MSLFSKPKPDTSADAAPPAPTTPASNSGTVSLTKGNRVSLTKESGGVYTLITAWGSKDYDLFALVEFIDGHVEVVSCFGTLRDPNQFSLKSSDGAVVHVSGDKTAYGKDLPQEVMTVRLNPNIKCVVPVVYSAKNSGTGSFRHYQVSTYILPGVMNEVPKEGVAGMVEVKATDASTDSTVYTFVPAVIHNLPGGAEIAAVNLYSRSNSELRPTVRNGHVTMDSGHENGSK